MSLQDWSFWGTIFSGFLTPIITGITIYFLYKAFTKQNEGNIINKESQLKLGFESNYDRIFKLVLEFENSFKISYDSPKNSRVAYSQLTNIEKFIDDMYNHTQHEKFIRSSRFSSLYLILTQFEYTLDFIMSNKKNNSFYEYCLTNVSVLYLSKLNIPMSRFVELYSTKKLIFENIEVSETKVPKKLIEKMIEIHQRFKKLVNDHEL